MYVDKDINGSMVLKKIVQHPKKLLDKYFHGRRYEFV